jgi:hypothetical protein
MPDVLRIARARLGRIVLPTVLVLCGSLPPVVAGDARSEAEARLKSDITFLASDELEGRGVGTEGLNRAADFIREEFRKAGLKVDVVKGEAFQKFTMTTGAKLGSPNELAFAGPEGKKLEPKYDAAFRTCSFGGSGKFDAPLVFVGYGVEAPKKGYDDYAGLDEKGKVVVILRRVPRQKDPKGPFSGPHGQIAQEAGLQTKIGTAVGKGAAAVVFVNDAVTAAEDQEKARTEVEEAREAVVTAAEQLAAIDPADTKPADEARRKLLGAVERLKAAREHVKTVKADSLMEFGYGGRAGSRTVPIVHLTRAACDELLKAAGQKSVAEIEAEIDGDLKPRSVELAGWTAAGVTAVEKVETEVKNVIGVLEGEGPLAEETIVVGAHYDHVGRGSDGSLASPKERGQIHNGADDNASGTVTLLELARRLGGAGKKYPRRIVFIAFTAEETGLIGSARYVKEPLYPLEKTVAMFNMDMVGRLDKEKLIVYGTGTAQGWEEMVKAEGKKQGFELTLKPGGTGPSDHASFYPKKISVLHFFTGTHSDYHRPGDDAEKINVPGMRRVLDMVESIVTTVAEAPERPKFVESKAPSVAQPTGSRPYFGSIPEFGSNEPGYAISGAAPGSPAALGGLKGGDHIVRLATTKVENLEDFDVALRKFKAGDEIEVEVTRKEDGKSKNVVLKVKLGAPK